MKIKLLPKVDLPREKLEKYGVKKLKDHELLAILLGSGVKDLNVLELSKKILKAIFKNGKETLKLQDLLQIKGLGKVKGSQIIALLELGKRLNSNQNPEILSPQDIWKFCSDFRDSKREHFAAFYLDTQNRLIERQIISIGTLNSSLVHPREVFEPAIKFSAATVIIAHNHPSGAVDPSREDREITKRILEASKILGIELADHVIVTKNNFLSYQQEGLL